LFAFLTLFRGMIKPVRDWPEFISRYSAVLAITGFVSKSL
jgi:hypothetical protein